MPWLRLLAVLPVACNSGGDTGLGESGYVAEDPEPPTPVDAFAIVRGVAPSDHAGLSFTAGDFDGTGDVDYLFGTFFATPPEGDQKQGVAYVMTETPSGEASLGSAGVQLWNEGASLPSNITVTSGDVDGDGRDDLLIGDIHSNVAGATFLFLSPVDDSSPFNRASRTFIGGEGGEHTGVSVAYLGDVDGDGLGDLALGAHKAVNDGAAGAVYLISDPMGHSLRSGVLDVAAAIYTAEEPNDFLGFKVAAPGDVDGDGLADLLMGAPAHASLGPHGGAAYLVLGPGPRDGVVSDAAVARLVGDAGQNVGYGLAGAADINGDGYRDVVVTASGDGQGGNDAGAVYLFLGPTLPSGSVSQAHATLVGELVEGRLGFSVDAAGDVNGDGHPDLVIGAPRASALADSGGAAYVVFGPLEGVGPVSSFGTVIPGLEPQGQLGSAVLGLGDVDGDGLSDIGVGAVGLDERAGAYLLFHGADL